MAFKQGMGGSTGGRGKMVAMMQNFPVPGRIPRTFEALNLPFKYLQILRATLCWGTFSS